MQVACTYPCAESNSLAFPLDSLALPLDSLVEARTAWQTLKQPGFSSSGLAEARTAWLTLKRSG